MSAGRFRGSPGIGAPAVSGPFPPAFSAAFSAALAASQEAMISAIELGKKSRSVPSGVKTCVLRRIILAAKVSATSWKSKAPRSRAIAACKVTWSSTSPSSPRSSASGCFSSTASTSS